MVVLCVTAMVSCKKADEAATTEEAAKIEAVPAPEAAAPATEAAPAPEAAAPAPEAAQAVDETPLPDEAPAKQ
ncbi:MAG: hypothetical protein C0403_18595 [Desulfobacterium sp.]|nr:hypothetical protein [Desulfobacterium sp.]